MINSTQITRNIRYVAAMNSRMLTCLGASLAFTILVIACAFVYVQYFRRCIDSKSRQRNFPCLCVWKHPKSESTQWNTNAYIQENQQHAGVRNFWRTNSQHARIRHENLRRLARVTLCGRHWASGVLASSCTRKIPKTKLKSNCDNSKVLRFHVTRPTRSVWRRESISIIPMQ